jgi:hypothetical protein
VVFVGKFENIRDLLCSSRPNDDLRRNGVVLGLIFGMKVNIGAGGADRLLAENGGELGDEFGCNRVKSRHEGYPYKEINVQSILTAKKAISY